MEISRPDKILLALFELSSRSTRPCNYEDIVVKAFELFPKEFQLRGYPQFPDSSDIHKPLYGPLKRAGLVRSASKTFSLTEKGLARASELVGGNSVASPNSKKRLRRPTEEELNRIKASSAWRLFSEGYKESILDTDFFSYIGATVRTERNDFIGRLNSVADAVNEAIEIEPSPATAALQELHKFLTVTFSELIRKKTEG